METIPGERSSLVHTLSMVGVQVKHKVVSAVKLGFLSLEASLNLGFFFRFLPKTPKLELASRVIFGVYIGGYFFGVYQYIPKTQNSL